MSLKHLRELAEHISREMDLKAENADLKADNAALREQADVDRSFIEQYRHDRIDWEQAYYERDRAYARLAADNTALRERLEQWVAEAQDKANPQIRPMTRMENAWMDEQAKCGALEADNAALRERLEAAEWMRDHYKSEAYAFHVLNDALRKQRGADHKDNAALRERLEALERAAWGAVATIEDYEASDDWLDDRAKELRAALASQPEVTP